jgi:hypothetical protein
MKARIVALAACALLGLGAAGIAMAQQAVGSNASVVQTVRTRSTGEAALRASVVGGQVRYGDVITTGPGSRLAIRLQDRSNLTVGANASLTVDSFLVDTNSNPAGAVFAVGRGAFRFASGSGGQRRERVGFRTPTSTIGIRGTIIEGVVGPEAIELAAGEDIPLDLTDDPGTAALIVLVEGEIDLEVGGRRVTVRQPGQAVAISGSRLSRPFSLPPAIAQRFAARLPQNPGVPEGRPGQGPGQEDGPETRAGELSQTLAQVIQIAQNDARQQGLSDTETTRLVEERVAVAIAESGAGPGVVQEALRLITRDVVLPPASAAAVQNVKAIADTARARAPAAVRGAGRAPGRSTAPPTSGGGGGSDYRPGT